jgi:DNA (cytosine-5)-methyltransferase 1
MLTVRGLGVVLGDLSEMGYNCRYGVVSASSVGANHKRDRIWIVAYSQHIGRTEAQKDRENYGIQPESSSRSQLCVHEFEGASCLRETTDMAYSSSIGQQGQGQHEQPINSEESGDWKTNLLESIGRPEFWATEPNVGRVANGVAARVDRLKAIGNGQVPLCAATAWKLLKGDTND